MPSEDLLLSTTEQPQQELPQSQVKVCSSCHNPLVDSASTLFFLHEADAIVCSRCRDHVLSARVALLPASTRTLCDEVDAEFGRRSSQENEVNSSQTTRQTLDSHSIDHDVDMTPPSVSEPETIHPLISSLQSYHSKPSLLAVENSSSVVGAPRCQTQASTVSTDAKTSFSRHDYPSSSLDPLIDITRLRVRSQGRHCLYPGASFQGTQKSGRNSYDVNVTIVDVDFSSSTLCGYLQIRGLTDDWPELTTYFDAEIIGSRYGFLTQNWGANEQEDMVHWSRFPAFRNVKNELKKPHLTMSNRDRGAVFMRWKERFLVPDHRVQDISGASFAGFYYVCVDFNPPPPPTSMRTCPLAPATPDLDSFTRALPPVKVESPQRTRRDSIVHRGGRSAPTASMSGFYFHQNSEPYQQLSLSHVPECTSSSFEFR
jgi:hypothetical protein